MAKKEPTIRIIQSRTYGDKNLGNQKRFHYLEITYPSGLVYQEWFDTSSKKRIIQRLERNYKPHFENLG